MFPSQFYSLIISSNLLYKVFLHPPEEIPMVRDLGFAVPPGRHSLIAVRSSVVSNYEKEHMQSCFSVPYGNLLSIGNERYFFIISSDDRETYVSSSTILSLVITSGFVKHTAGISVVRLFFF